MSDEGAASECEEGSLGETGETTGSSCWLGDSASGSGEAETESSVGPDSARGLVEVEVAERPVA